MKVLVACYTVLAIAAGSRAVVQLGTKASQAPLPYVLSAVAAAVYLVLAFSMRRGGAWRLVALGAAVAELVGVLAVGTAELLSSHGWPDQTVWTGYGVGYGFAPLVLPLAAIVLLRRQLSLPG